MHGTTVGAHFVKSSFQEDLHGRPRRLDGSEIFMFRVLGELMKKLRISILRRTATGTPGQGPVRYRRRGAPRKGHGTCTGAQFARSWPFGASKLHVRNVHGTTAGAHFVKSSLQEDLHGRPPRLDGSEIFMICVFQEITKKLRISILRRPATGFFLFL